MEDVLAALYGGQRGCPPRDEKPRPFAKSHTGGTPVGDYISATGHYLFQYSTPMSAPRRTYTEYEMTAAQRRAKFAWSQTYILHGQNALMAQMLTNMFSRENGQLQRPTEFPAHITQQLWDMANQLNKTYTCPVCLDLTTETTFHLTVCGHILCKDCRLRVGRCPICRTTLTPPAHAAAGTLTGGRAVE